MQHRHEAVATRLEEAVRLTPTDRREIVEAFFLAHPGSSLTAFGYGTAVLDFVEWEIGSGRIGVRGSAWWRAVNGSMVLDLRDAHESRPSTAGTALWRGYAHSKNGHTQERMWRAHQRSLHAALPAARRFLRHETPAERAFVALVLRIVDRAALACRPTDTPELGALANRFYPLQYPIKRSTLDVLREAFGGATRTATREAIQSGST